MREDPDKNCGGPAGIRTPDPRLSPETTEGLHDLFLCVFILARLRARETLDPLMHIPFDPYVCLKGFLRQEDAATD